MRCDCWRETPASAPSRSSRSRSASARRPRSSASSTRCSCGRCHSAIPSRLVALWEDGSSFGFPKNTPAPGNYADWTHLGSLTRRRSARHPRLQPDRRRPAGEGGGRGRHGELLRGDGRVACARPRVHGEGRRAGHTSPGRGDRPWLWIRRFGGDRNILGRSVLLNGQQYSIVGVMPARFAYPFREIEIWVPVGFTGEDLTNRGGHYLWVVGRLAPGHTIADLNAELRTLANRLAHDFPQTNASRRHVRRLAARRLRRRSRHGSRRPARRRWRRAPDHGGESREPAAGARDWTLSRNGGPRGDRGGRRAHRPADGRREPGPRRARGTRGPRRGVGQLRGPRHPGAGQSPRRQRASNRLARDGLRDARCRRHRHCRRARAGATGDAHGPRLGAETGDGCKPRRQAPAARRPRRYRDCRGDGARRGRCVDDRELRGAAAREPRVPGGSAADASHAAAVGHIRRLRAARELCRACPRQGAGGSRRQVRRLHQRAAARLEGRDDGVLSRGDRATGSHAGLRCEQSRRDAGFHGDDGHDDRRRALIRRS